MDYVDRLKKLRKKMKVSQREVAEILGCQQSAISKYETRKAKYTIENIITLCEFYHVSADYVFGLPDDLTYPDF